MQAFKLWRITLDTNPEDCNLSCTMCEEHSPYSTFKQSLYETTGMKHRRMPEAWLDDIFWQAKGLGVREIIPSTMGEPLIYKHFAKIVDLCYQYQLKLNLTTNGTFPKISGKTTTEWAKLIVPITTDVKISWNGASAATAELVMQGIDFEQVLQNTRDFIHIRDAHYRETGHYCRVTFQLTFLQNNMHELSDMIRLAASLGVDRVKGHHLWAHFDEIKDLSFRRDAESIAQWNTYVEAAQQAAERHRKPDGSAVLLENIIPLQPEESVEIPETYECPFLEKELWISATGKISPCCAPDALREGLGDFGNIRQWTLEEVLTSPVYQYLVQHYKKHDLCKQCTMRKPV